MIETFEVFGLNVICPGVYQDKDIDREAFDKPAEIDEFVMGERIDVEGAGSKAVSSSKGIVLVV